MKKRVLVVIFTLVGILSFQGCKTKHKYYDINISKIGNIELLTIEEITKKYNVSLNDSWIRSLLGYKNKSDLKKLRIEFFTQFNTLDSGTPLILNPCSSEKTYDVYDNVYPEISTTLEGGNRDYKVHTYFDIETLKELGYISRNIEEQEDLCLFTEYTFKKGELVYTEEHYKSNKLVYKAEEINNIVEAYENMR